MRVGIIGAGKLGCALAIGLSNVGVDIGGVYSKSETSIQILNEKLSRNFENNLKHAIQDVDIIFLTVPDTVLENISNVITEQIEDSLLRSKTFLHCSGAATSDKLWALEKAGAYIGSLHPIQTFADRELGWKGLFNITFGFEGGKEAQQVAEKIVEKFQAEMLLIEKQNKPLYHAAACVLSNYTVTLAYFTSMLLEKAGLPPKEGLHAFMPLLENTVKNIEAYGVNNALTGPISRGDVETVKGHMDAINQKASDSIQAYAILGEMTLKLAKIKESITKEQALLLENLFKK